MPTKPNRAGEQQNYVPAGNGEASGEYGDNSTGSNIHYKQDKKETQPIKVDIKQEPSKGDKQKQNIKSKQDNFEYVKKNSTFKGKTLETLNNIINEADDECVNLLNKAYSKHKFWFDVGAGKYYPRSGIYCDKADFIENGRGSGKVGSVWFHENGHLLDSSYSNSPNTKEWASVSFKDEQGNTLYDYLQEELKDLTINRFEKIGDIKKLRYKYYEEKMTKEEQKEYERLKEIRKNVNLDEFRKKDTELLKIYGDSQKYTEESDKLYMESYKQGMGEKNYNRYNELRKKHSNAEEYANFNYYTDVCVIGDAISSKVQAHNDLGLGIGHPLAYYKRYPHNLALEFFANMFSAKSTRTNSTIELTKKYFPKSCAMFEKILKEAF